ncbi:SspB family protein [Sneathiella sp.]|uniref:SspB family protein n=1 Tax=Sneathiella sp. TaxID=1964365 RepID=UPI002FE42232
MNDEINYAKMVEKALMEVVRESLRHVAQNGLPGDQHFYVTFKTRYPGVVIPAHLAERYPDEMTIVLQHQFWNVVVEPDYFSVDLSFNHKRETLVIPFAALAAFADPSVQFGLQFSVTVPEPEVAPLEETAASSGDHDETGSPAPQGDKAAEVITLDAFRKK